MIVIRAIEAGIGPGIHQNLGIFCKEDEKTLRDIGRTEITREAIIHLFELSGWENFELQGGDTCVALERQGEEVGTLLKQRGANMPKTIGHC